MILPPEFTQPLRLQDGLIMAQKGTKTAFFDAAGNMVIRPQEQTRGPFSEGLAPAWITDAGKTATAYVDRSLQPVIRGDFRDAGPFSDGMADVAVPDEWGVVKRGYIDKTGALVIEPRFATAEPFSAQFSFARPFHGPLAPVVMGRQSAWIDVDGKIVWRSD